MNPLSESQFRKLLDASGLKAADATLGIGRELTYIDAVARAVVLHFAKSDPQSYVRDATTCILELASEWLVVPRYGPVLDLGLLDSPTQLAAVSFGAPERDQLADYLSSRPMDPGATSTDLYVLSGNGKALITWDHHTAENGLLVELVSVDDGSQLLRSLNNLGAELELYSREHA